MPEYLPYLCAVGGLLLGVLPSFFLLKTKLAAKDSIIVRADADLENSRKNVSEREERLDKQEREIEGLRTQLQTSSNQLTQARTENKNLEDKIAEQSEAQQEQEKVLRERFENLANDILDAKTRNSLIQIRKT